MKKNFVFLFSLAIATMLFGPFHRPLEAFSFGDFFQSLIGNDNNNPQQQDKQKPQDPRPQSHPDKSLPTKQAQQKNKRKASSETADTLIKDVRELNDQLEEFKKCLCAFRLFSPQFLEMLSLIERKDCTAKPKQKTEATKIISYIAKDIDGALVITSMLLHESLESPEHRPYNNALLGEAYKETRTNIRTLARQLKSTLKQIDTLEAGKKKNDVGHANRRAFEESVRGKSPLEKRAEENVKSIYLELPAITTKLTDAMNCPEVADEISKLSDKSLKQRYDNNKKLLNNLGNRPNRQPNRSPWPLQNPSNYNQNLFDTEDNDDGYYDDLPNDSSTAPNTDKTATDDDSNGWSRNRNKQENKPKTPKKPVEQKSMNNKSLVSLVANAKDLLDNIFISFDHEAPLVGTRNVTEEQAKKLDIPQTLITQHDKILQLERVLTALESAQHTDKQKYKTKQKVLQDSNTNVAKKVVTTQPNPPEVIKYSDIEKPEYKKNIGSLQAAILQYTTALLKLCHYEDVKSRIQSNGRYAIGTSSSANERKQNKIVISKMATQRCHQKLWNQLTKKQHANALAQKQQLVETQKPIIVGILQHNLKTLEATENKTFRNNFFYGAVLDHNIHTLKFVNQCLVEILRAARTAKNLGIRLQIASLNNFIKKLKQGQHKRKLAFSKTLHGILFQHALDKAKEANNGQKLGVRDAYKKLEEEFNRKIIENTELLCTMGIIDKDAIFTELEITNENELNDPRNIERKAQFQKRVIEAFKRNIAPQLSAWRSKKSNQIKILLDAFYVECQHNFALALYNLIDESLALYNAIEKNTQWWKCTQDPAGTIRVIEAIYAKNIYMSQELDDKQSIKKVILHIESPQTAKNTIAFWQNEVARLEVIMNEKLAERMKPSKNKKEGKKASKVLRLCKGKFAGVDENNKPIYLDTRLNNHDGLRGYRNNKTIEHDESTLLLRFIFAGKEYLQIVKSDERVKFSQDVDSEKSEKPNDPTKLEIKKGQAIVWTEAKESNSESDYNDTSASDNDSSYPSDNDSSYPSDDDSSYASDDDSSYASDDDSNEEEEEEDVISD